SMAALHFVWRPHRELRFNRREAYKARRPEANPSPQGGRSARVPRVRGRLCGLMGFGSGGGFPPPWFGPRLFRAARGVSTALPLAAQFNSPRDAFPNVGGGGSRSLNAPRTQCQNFAADKRNPAASAATRCHADPQLHQVGVFVGGADAHATQDAARLIEPNELVVVADTERRAGGPPPP